MSVSFIISWIVYNSDQCMIVQKYSIFLMYYHWIEHILLYTTYTKEFWNMRRGKVSWRNLLPIRCTCNLSNKICSNHRIIILYNDQHLIILYNHFLKYFYLVHLDLKVTLHFEQNIDGYNILYDRAITACMHTKQNKNIAYSLMIHFFRVKNIFSIWK